MRATKPGIFNAFANAVSGSLGDLFNVPSYMDSGFPAPGGTPVRPPLGYINWLFYQAMNALRYHSQRSIADWDTDEEDYDTGDIVRYTDNKIYCLEGTATAGLAPPSDPTNWRLWLKSPFATASQWAEAIWAWANNKRHRGFGLDHQGLPAGRFFQWTEDWVDIGGVQKGPADVTTDLGGGLLGDSGNWFGRWRWGLYGNGGQMGIFANGPWLADLTTHPWGPILGVAADVGTQNSAAVVEAVKPFLMMPEAFAALECAFSVNGPAGTSDDQSFAWGFGDGTLISSNSRDEINNGSAIIPGAYFARQHGGANWVARSRTPGGSAISTTLGTAYALDTPHRGRIEVMGTSSADDSAASVRFYIDGALVATHAHSLANAKLVPFIRASDAGSANDHVLNVGPMRFTARLDLGDQPII